LGTAYRFLRSRAEDTSIAVDQSIMQVNYVGPVPHAPFARPPQCACSSCGLWSMVSLTALRAIGRRCARQVALTKAVLPAMLQRKGSLVFISSIQVRVRRAHQSERRPLPSSSLWRCMLLCQMSVGMSRVMRWHKPQLWWRSQGLLALPFRSSYSASKHALQAFANALRAEVAGRGAPV
jgi:NAD(P)-dependent dehydrogenase (short-subunit alcohol dehydrogenase family)